ncbi:uncharacterized protein [Typha latifolia]|uniref:uncharacterized protein isoform X1 n=1 Tax=Typha latifolia TaxID=4733 RepID=UPI003C2FE4F6
MFPRRRNPSQETKKREEPWLASSLKPENFLPGLVIGLLLGLFMDLSASYRGSSKRNSNSTMPSASAKKQSAAFGGGSGEELKMVLVVRQDLKMGVGKIASQCAHAATGMYAELLQSHRALLRQWEQFGQAKIILSCKNQQEMYATVAIPFSPPYCLLNIFFLNITRNKLKDAADRCGLPTHVVADAGRTQVLSGSRTVLAIGPGRKSDIDSVTGKLRLL